LSTDFWPRRFSGLDQQSWPIGTNGQKLLLSRTRRINSISLVLLSFERAFLSGSGQKTQMDNGRNRFFGKVSTEKFLQKLYIRDGLDSLENARLNKRESFLGGRNYPQERVLGSLGGLAAALHGNCELYGLR
jgi:hypothetical protein